MTYHQDADDQVARFKVRWTDVHETVKEWVARMTTLVECWNKLDGNVGELSSWVTKQVSRKIFQDFQWKIFVQDSAAPVGTSEISIEKLETQLNTLKTMFAEKQKLVADLEIYGAGKQGPGGTEEGVAPPEEAAPAPEAPAEPAPAE